jgi:hypothetical protein
MIPPPVSNIVAKIRWQQGLLTQRVEKMHRKTQPDVAAQWTNKLPLTLVGSPYGAPQNRKNLKPRCYFDAFFLVVVVARGVTVAHTFPRRRLCPGFRFSEENV